jgi:transposase
MLIEGHCTIGVKEAIKKYGYTEQRYYQLLKQYHQGGAEALTDKKRGSDKQPVRTREAVNQTIRLRFLDPFASAGVISQKLKQIGYKVSKRSVERTITDYGLQKKLIR